MHSGSISLQHMVTVKATTTHISTMEVENTNVAGAHQLPPNPILHPVPKILQHRSSSVCPGAVNPCIFSNYTTLPFLVKSYFKEQGREHPGMIQTGHHRSALASCHPLPKGLVKPGKLPSTLAGACGYPKLPST